MAGNEDLIEHQNPGNPQILAKLRKARKTPTQGPEQRRTAAEPRPAKEPQKPPSPCKTITKLWKPQPHPRPKGGPRKKGLRGRDRHPKGPRLRNEADEAWFAQSRGGGFCPLCDNANRARFSPPHQKIIKNRWNNPASLKQ